MAIDLGDRRTGLAVGDDATGVVTPLAVLAVPRGAGLVEEIARSAAAHHPDALVVGLPLNMDGTEGERARIIRGFAALLAERCRLPVHYQDERLTSDEAEQQLAGSGRTHRQKKALRDALAAAAILRDYLNR